MSFIRCKGAILSSFVALRYVAASIAACISFTVLLTMGIQLRAFQIFTLLLSFNAMKNTICHNVGEAFRFFVEVHIALERVQVFLEQGTPEGGPPRPITGPKVTDNPEVATPPSGSPIEKRTTPNAGLSARCRSERKLGLSETRNPPQDTRICLVNISSGWTDSSSVVVRASMVAAGSDLVVVTGAVGSGKSSLLLSVSDELPLSNGQIRVTGRIAYVSQTPWLFSGSVRENILFGRPFNQRLYDQVLDACDLRRDLSMLARGQWSPVGESGANLSGGQRSRVGLARALYSEADIYLMDDPLSALDANVSQRLFDKCICGMLASRLRILVTHQARYMHTADRVFVMERGSLIPQHNPKRLQDNGAAVRTSLCEGRGASSYQEVRLSENDSTKGASRLDITTQQTRESTVPTTMGQNPEKANTGSVGFKTYWLYLTAGTSPLTLGVVLLFLCFSQGTRGGVSQCTFRVTLKFRIQDDLCLFSFMIL